MKWLLTTGTNDLRAEMICSEKGLYLLMTLTIKIRPFHGITVHLPTNVTPTLHLTSSREMEKP